MIDQFRDRQHHYLVQIARERPDLVEFYKTASIDDEPNLPPSSFADPDGRLFPIHNPQHAILSKLYAEKQANVSERVMRNIDTALELYGVPAHHVRLPRQKEASYDDTTYLLPQYQRLAVRTADDVQPAAEKLVSQARRLKVATLADASVRLVKVAAEHGLMEDELPETVFKYAGMTPCDAGVLLDWVEARAQATTHPEHRDLFDKLAHAITRNFPSTGVISERGELVKMAALIEEADRAAGLDRYYGRTLLDPLQTVFNMDKVAEEVVDLGRAQIPLRALIAMPEEMLAEVLGDDLVREAKGPDGQLDPEQLKAILETLPADLKTLLATTVEPYAAKG